MQLAKLSSKPPKTMTTDPDRSRRIIEDRPSSSDEEVEKQRKVGKVLK